MHKTLKGGKGVNKTEYLDEVFTKVFKKDIYISEKELEIIYKTFLEVLYGQLKNGKTVTLRGFGKFYVKDAAERTGINPRTFEKIIIRGKKIPKFTAGNEFKENIN